FAVLELCITSALQRGEAQAYADGFQSAPGSSGECLKAGFEFTHRIFDLRDAGGIGDRLQEDGKCCVGGGHVMSLFLRGLTDPWIDSVLFHRKQDGSGPGSPVSTR